MQYGAFALCKKGKQEVTKVIGKKCLNEHSFRYETYEMEFCPKCGMTLIDDEVIDSEFVPDGWEVEENLPDHPIRRVFLDDDVHDLFIDNMDHEGLKTCYVENHGEYHSGIELYGSGYYLVGDPEAYIKNFKEKFADHINVLEANYESVEIKCGVIVEHD